MMQAEDVRQLMCSQCIDNTAVTPRDGKFLVRLPFTDRMGDPVEMSVKWSGDEFLLDDLGHTAGLLFECGQHKEDSPALSLVKKLADSYGISLDYSAGLLCQRTSDHKKILDFAKILIAVQNVIPDIQTRKLHKRKDTPLTTRLARDIQPLMTRHVQREVQVEGRHENWLVDYKYIHREPDKAMDILIVTADFKVQEPRRRAEHVLTLAMDILEEEERSRHLRVVYDVDGDKQGERAAELISGFQTKIRYRAYNYSDVEQKTNLHDLTLQELSPVLFPSASLG